MTVRQQQVSSCLLAKLNQFHHIGGRHLVVAKYLCQRLQCPGTVVLGDRKGIRPVNNLSSSVTKGSLENLRGTSLTLNDLWKDNPVK